MFRTNRPIPFRSSWPPVAALVGAAARAERGPRGWRFPASTVVQPEESPVTTPRQGEPDTGTVDTGLRVPGSSSDRRPVALPTAPPRRRPVRALVVALLVAAVVVAGVLGLRAAAPRGSQAQAQAPTQTSVVTLPGAAVAFGEAYTYDDGLELVVNPPVTYAPSDGATGLVGRTPVRVQVVVTNGTEDVFRPNTLSVEASSAGTPASQVWDPDQGAALTGPDLSVPPGGTVEFALAFDVTDVADVRLAVTPALYGYGVLDVAVR